MKSATLEEQINRDLVARAPSCSPRPLGRLTLGPIGFIFCFANAFVFTAIVARYLKGSQSYADLVSGPLAWANADKSFDFRIFHVFLITFFLFLAVLTCLCRRLQRITGVKLTLERGFALALIPGAFWVGSRLATNSFGDMPVECLLSGCAVIILFFSLSRARLVITADEIFTVTATSLLVLGFAFFGSLGLATTLSRGFHVTVSESVTVRMATTICGCAFATTIWAIWASATIGKIQKRLRHVVFGVQLLLLSLWTVVIPPAIVENGERAASHQPVVLLTMLFLVVAISGAALMRRWITQVDSPLTNLLQSLVPVAILPIAVFVATSHPVFPTFFGDEFHTGEHLLPWQQLHDFGKLPFVNFIPVHPLMDFFVSGANALLFDGTLANYENSRAILFAVAAALTFLCVERFAGIGLALCLAMAANLWDRLLLVPALLVLLCGSRLIAQSQRWLVVWFCVCPVAVCYNPAVGVALTLGSLPVALVQVRQIFGEDRKFLLRLALWWGLAAIALVVIPSTRAMCLGFAHFLIDNGRTALVAHGIQWQANAAQTSSVRGVLGSPLVWETLRFSWVIVLLITAWIFVSRASDWRNAPRQTLAITLMACLFLFFLSGWTINRIDADRPSRTGEVSYLACLYILPLVLFSADPRRYFSSLLLLFGIGFFQGGMADFINSGSKPHAPITAGTLLEKPSAVLTVPPQCISIDGPSLNLPNLGHIYAPKKILDSLTGLKNALSDMLYPGETYLDLTGRQANYFYLGMPVAVSYGSPWLAANTVLEDDLLAEIRSRPPPVVWLAPTFFYDGDHAALRTYKIYRFFAEHYVPLSRDGCTFLVAPDRVARSGSMQQNDINLLRGAFANGSLARLPSAWGSSWTSIRSRFTPIRKLSATEAPVLNGASISLNSNDDSVSGAKSDFIKFDFWSNLSPTAKMDIDIMWMSESGPGVGRLRVANGTNLVPLGVFPEWLLSRNILEIKIQPHWPAADLKYVIHNPELLRLKD